jgi:hypothetical protein
MRYSLLCLAVLAGCASSGDAKYEQFRSNVLNAPLPQSDDARRAECANIRAEMARVRGWVAAGATQPGMWGAIYYAEGQKTLAVWEQRAADIQCSASFSNTTTKDPLTQCMDICENRARKPAAECFQTCTQK